MSAFIVNKKHIDALCLFIKDNQLAFFPRSLDLPNSASNQSINLIGQILVEENYRSYNTRYDCKEKSGQLYAFDPNVKTKLTPVQIIVACHCYDYQSCETDDYKETIAARIVQVIERKAMELGGFIANNITIDQLRKTMEWNTAAWEIIE